MREERSLLVFKCGDLSLVASVLEFTDGWCKGHGMKAFIRNTPDGFYEIYEVKSDAP